MTIDERLDRRQEQMRKRWAGRKLTRKEMREAKLHQEAEESRRIAQEKSETLEELLAHQADLLCASCNKNKAVINKILVTLEICEECKRKSRMAGSHDLTLEERNIMWDQQKGNCAICNVPLEKPHIDHCHKKGHVRGILCGSCNTALGMLKDNPDTLIKAAIYLKRNANSRKWCIAFG